MLRTGKFSYEKVSFDVDVTQRWHALGLVDAEVDFRQYSLSTIFMAARVADCGMIGLCGYPGMGNSY